MKYFFTLFLFTAIHSFSQTAGDYRSKQSGNWNDIANWERYDGTNWVTAAFPSSTDGEITIMAGHNITYNVTNLLIDQVAIAQGATLTVGDVDNFSIPDGPGVDLKIWGTLDYNKGWAGYCSVWEVYEGGVANINCAQYGSACNTWNIKPGGVMNFLNVSIWLNATTINNEGILNFNSDAGRLVRSDNLSHPGIIKNLSNGVINIEKTISFGSVDYFNEKYIQVINEGELNIKNGSTLNYHGSPASEDNISFTNLGKIHFEDDALLLNNGFFHLNGGEITGNGTIRNQEGWRTNVPFILPAGITLDMRSGYRNYFGGSEELTVEGNLRIEGRLSNDGFSNDPAKLKLAAEGVCNAMHVLYLGNAIFTNEGTLDLEGTDNVHFEKSAYFINSGTIKVSGALNLRNYTADGISEFLNEGTIEVMQNAYLTANTNYGQPNEFFKNTETGIIAGKGFIDLQAVFTNNGNITPGTSPGILTFNSLSNPLQNNSKLTIEIAGSTAGIQFDQLQRNGNLVLDGILNVAETEANVPDGGFEIISLGAGVISGSFTAVNLPQHYELQVGASNVMLVKSSVLPLDFLTFNVVEKTATALLTWATANEVNTAHFNIQKSIDGKIFADIGRLGSANTPGTHHYTFTDPTPVSGINYYRLQQVDLDGRYTHSKTVSMVYSSSGIKIYPNPVAHSIKANVAVNAKWMMSVYDNNGRVVLQKPAKSDDGYLSVDVSGLQPGYYVLVIDNGKTKFRERFLKVGR